jgi:hypothetical protein
MRSILLLMLLSPALVAATPPDAVAVPASAHGHEHAHPASTSLTPGHRWRADAPLRRAMQQIRHVRAEGVRSTTDALHLATTIDAAIADMIAHCALPADADAALHQIIGQLGGAAGRLRRDADPRQSLAAIDAALERYALVFDETAAGADNPAGAESHH